MTELARNAAAYILGRELAPGEDPDAFVTACATQARALVAEFTGDAPVPAEVLARAMIEVASELHHRRGAPSGIQLDPTGQASSELRLARDPLTPVYPMLRPWVTPW
jgi:hypothetical protein